MNIYEREVKCLAVKSRLPDADWVINPYIGCTHKCKYCYAVFMRRFSGCQEPWGEYIVVKHGKGIRTEKFRDEETILIGSVTDGYQPIEKRYRRTREVLSQLCSCKANVEILTKSKLILDDLELLKAIPNIKIGISMNTLDDDFCRLMEPGASTVSDRIEVLRRLRQEGIAAYLFVSPIFPGITDSEELIKATRDYVSEYYFENLNLRGEYKTDILSAINEYAPHLRSLYRDIYINKNTEYWENYAKEIAWLGEVCHISVKEYFYHEKIRKGKEKS